MLNDIGQLSENELKEHLNELPPNDIKCWSSDKYCIYYIYSNVGRTAIVLSSGENKDNEELRGKALDELFKYS